MRRTWLLVILASVALGLVAQQRFSQTPGPAYEVRSVFPREVSPAHYEQVTQRELQALADQGWELVSVMPYVYRNEERGGDSMNPKPVVTQTYPAYFFKRTKMSR